MAKALGDPDIDSSTPGNAAPAASSIPYFIEALRNSLGPFGSYRYYWSAFDGQPAVVTYSFMSSVPTDEGLPTSAHGGNPFTTFQPFTPEWKDAARAALRAWQDVSGLTFVEVSAADELAGTRGTIEFGRHTMTDGTAGYAYYPISLDGQPVPGGGQGDIFISTDFSSSNDQVQIVLRHEIGHALGLKHSFDAPDALPSGEDNVSNTVMSYTGARFANHPLGMFDIAAIQQIYGINTTVRSGSNSYAFGSQNYVWDGGGIDTITAAGFGQSVHLELTPGSWNYGGAAPATSILAPSQLFIGYGTIIENAVGSDFADFLAGNDGNNVLRGGAGNDTLRGGAGKDTLDGAAGIDTADYSDKTQAVSVTLSGATVVTVKVNGVAEDKISNIENVTGGSGNDSLTGDAFANALNGGAGADTMAGGAGDDTYKVDNTGDVVIEKNGEGSDQVNSSVSFSLGGQFIERLVLTGSGNIDGTGNSLANTLIGNAGNNVLDGGSGADSMAGGVGNDTYKVDNAGDVVIEKSGEGSDQVNSSVSFSLNGQYVERLTLTGSGNINGTGNSLTNTLIGNAGNNVLDGGSGADTMAGGAGNDTYKVDNAGDVVIEKSGEGSDQVNSSVSFSLNGQYVERLTLTGSGNINGTGNSLANALTGNAGNNVLNGGSGADTMRGNGGDDQYYVDNANDAVIEEAGGGTDRVVAYVSHTLSANVENIATNATSGTSAIDLTGNSLANDMRGNAGANVLNGKGGADIMRGYGGKDIFLFDTALGTSNIDTIADFSVTDDTIRLDKAIFDTIVGTGLLSLAQFAANASGTARDANDRIIYETDTGKLFFDRNGSAAGGSTQFATLDAGLALSNADFVVV